MNRQNAQENQRTRADLRGSQGNRQQRDRRQAQAGQARRTELLSPAGSYETFLAVLAAGADAVYAGLKRFSARAYAENLSDEELLRAMDEAHLRGRKVYLALNTLLKEDELTEALHVTESFCEAGIDALIVQDLGLAAQISKHFPDLPLHASTQMSVTGPYGLRFLEARGFSQAVLPRELSLKEIRALSAQTELKLECFVHGALCYCYSGRCLMSSVIGGRSANRGRCAQPCRLPYQTGRGQKKEMYPLSLKDLCAADAVPLLLDAGVTSFKIEGRMKGLEYAAGVTEIYRQILDAAEAELAEAAGSREDPAAISGVPAEPSAADRRARDARLAALGSRSGFTNGYLVPDARGRMVSMEKPSHQKDSEDPYVRSVRARYARGPEKIPADMRVTIRPGAPVRLTMSAAGRSVTVEGDIVQAAAGRPLTEALVLEKVTRTGGTPFVVRDCEIVIEDGCFVPVSALNRLRQQAVSGLTAAARPQRGCSGGAAPEISERAEEEEAREAGGCADGDMAQAARGAGADVLQSGNACASADALRRPEDVLMTADAARPEGARSLYVSVVRPAQLAAVLSFPEAEFIILDCDGFAPGEVMKSALARVHAAGRKCLIALPQTFRLQTARRWAEAVRRGDAPVGRSADIADGFLIRNPDEAAFLQDPDLFPARPFTIADAGLYGWNEAARDTLLSGPADLLTASYELSRHDTDGAGQLLTLYGRTPLMVSAQCIAENTSGCRKAPPESAPDLFLHDRKGNRFPVRRLCATCENVIYNCVPTDLFPEAAAIRRMKWAGWRIDFVGESPQEVCGILERYRAFAAGGRPAPMDAFTYGAWKRGTE